MDGKRLLAPLVVVMVVAASCSSGDDRGTPDPGAPVPEATEAQPGIEARRVEADLLRDEGHVVIADLVATDDLPPTAVGWATDGDASGTHPVVWQLGDDQSWTRTDLTVPQGTDAALRDVAGGPAGPVAVGVTTTDGLTQAATWARTDDRWGEPVPLSDLEGSSTADDVAAHGELMVAHGRLDPPGAEGVSQRNRVWVSRNGSAWEDAGLDGATDEGTVLTDVAAGPGGLAVVGRRADGETSTAVAWTSTDGQEWDAATLEGPGPSLAKVVPLGDGFVAGGAVTPEATSVPATWRTDGDGRWTGPTIDLATRVTDRAQAGGSGIVSLSSRRGIVAASNGDASQPEVWLSTDGSGWEAWPTPITATPGYDTFPSITDVALDGQGRPVVVVEEGPNLLVPDDETWTEAPGAADVLPLDQPRVSFDDAVVHDGRLVLVGATGRPDRPGRPAVVAPVFWSRADDAWSRVEPEGLRDVTLAAAASTDLGVVAVGAEIFQLGQSGTEDGAAAVSDDARRWDAIGGLGSATTRYLGDVAAWRGGWVGVGFRFDIPDGTTSGVARPVRSLVRGNPTTGASRAIPVDLGPLATPAAASQSLDAVCTGALGLVLVGTDTGPTGRTEPLVAWADDVGSVWSVATADDAFARGRPGADLGDCAVDGRDEVLLHGTVTAADGDPEPLVWRSGDGRSWARLRSDAWGGGGGQALAEVAPLDEGWLAVGTDTPEGALSDVAVWLVGADDTVVRVPLAGDLVNEGEQSVLSVVVRGDEVLVVGEDDDAPAVWSLSLAALRSAA